MLTIKTVLAFVPALALALPLAVQDEVVVADLAQDTVAAKDAKAIRAASLDYVHAFYQAKPELIERSVSKDLTKYGFWMGPESNEYSKGMKMTFDSAIALAKKWNVKGWLPKDAPKSVKILDQMDMTAAVKVTAYWGIDYMHLEKVGGKWMIRHVMWQSIPRPKKPVEASTKKKR